MVEVENCSGEWGGGVLVDITVEEMSCELERKELSELLQRGPDLV